MISWETQIKQYQAFRSGTAIADLSFMGSGVFTGPDRKEFLQGLVTGDVLKLIAGQGLSACFLTPKGKVVSFFTLYDRGEDLLLVAEPPALQLLIDGLAKYFPLSDTTFTPTSDSWSIFLLSGHFSQTFFGQLFTEKVFSFQWISWKNNPLMAVSFPLYRRGDFLLLSPKEASSALGEALIQAGGQFVEPEVLETVRLEAGVPRIGIDVQENAYPVELNLDFSVSDDKGCYLGQEPIARLKSQGRPRRQLAGLKCETLLLVGSSVSWKGSPVGQLTSVAQSPFLNAPLALALLPAEAAEPGTVLSVGDGSTAQVVSLPFKNA
jgi:folate-binding protein YgfZ